MQSLRNLTAGTASPIASKTAIAVRYSLLLYWYTLFANASLYGTSPVCPLFGFPDEQELFGVDKQFLIGRDISVTPLLEPNVSIVDGGDCTPVSIRKVY